MKSGQIDYPSESIQLLRVDDLVPTGNVVATSTPATAAELSLIEEWGAHAEIADRPTEMITRERTRNAEWRRRNEDLIAERDRIIADPAASAAEKARAQDEKYGFEYQNWALQEGACRFEMMAMSSQSSRGI